MTSLTVRGYKCYGGCGLKHPLDFMVLHNKKRVCKTCDKKIQEQITKEKLTCYSCELVFDDERDLDVYGRERKRFCSRCLKEQEQLTFDRNRLHSLISKIFGIDRPTGLIYKQIKEYNTINNISYRNMYFTLDYITNIKAMKLNLKHGIGLVPNYHNEMLTYYADIKKKRESTKNFNPTKKIDVVRIKKPVIDDSYRQKRMIDMESLLK